MNLTNSRYLFPFLLAVSQAIHVTSSVVHADDAMSVNATPAVHLAVDSSDVVAATQLLADVERFDTLVATLEQEYGPYDRRLTEPLRSAGEAFERASDFGQARSVFERALHITRVNDGLYSESQIELLQKLIDCNIAMEDWNGVDSNFRYLHLLYTRVYEEGSVELERGLGQISDWHVLAFNNGIGGDMVDHLREANKLFQRRLALAQDKVEPDYVMVQFLEQNLAMTQYHLRMASGHTGDSYFNGIDQRTRDQLARMD